MMIGRVGSGSLSPTKQAQTRPETPVPVIGAATAVPVAPARLNTPGPDGSIWHEVQAGQTAWTVAAYYGVNVGELLALNNLLENSILRPGDKLLIRPPSVAASATPTAPPTGPQSTSTLLVAQLPISTPWPERDLLPRKSRAEEPPMLIWGLLFAATIVLAGSGARAAYILRQWSRNRSREE
jgi:LysM repeat protein